MSYYRPRTKYDGKVTFSVCLRVGGGTPVLVLAGWDPCPDPGQGNGVALS